MFDCVYFHDKKSDTNDPQVIKTINYYDTNEKIIIIIIIVPLYQIYLNKNLNYH